MNPESKRKKTALVLTGGGAYAAYEVGVVKALFSGKSPSTGYRKLKPDIIVGADFGAMNAGILVANSGDGLENAAAVLEDVWRNRIGKSEDSCGNGVIRLRGGASEFLDFNCYFSNPRDLFQTAVSDAGWAAQEAASLAANPTQLLHPLQNFNLRDFIDAEGLVEVLKESIPIEGLKKSRQDIQVDAVNLQNGKLKAFDREELIKIGYEAFLAAVSFPLFLPPVYIDTIPYIDSFLLLSRSLLEAAREADIIHVVYMDPPLEATDRSVLDSTLGVVTRAALVSAAASLNSQVDRIDRINQALRLIEKTNSNSDYPPKSDEIFSFLENSGWIMGEIGPEDELPEQREVEPYHPDVELGGSLGMLNFDSDQIDKLINRGYKDTIAFDPVAARAVVPESVNPE